MTKRILGLLLCALCLAAAGPAWSDSAPSAEVLPVNVDSLLAPGAPPELVAPALSYAVDLESKGTWVDENGWSTWTDSVQVPGARSMGFHAAVSLPLGARLGLLDESGREMAHYDTRRVAATGDQIWSVLVPGEVLNLSLRVPTGQRDVTRVDIDTLYLGRQASPLAAATPEAAATSGTLENWSCVRSSDNELAGDATVMYTVSATKSSAGQYQCSGTLMNDVPQDYKLHLLTAAHCGENNWDASSITVYWNRVSSCSAGLTDAFTAPGPTSSGGTTEALFNAGGDDYEDQWLILLSGGGVPSGSDAAFSGWDASDVFEDANGGPVNVFGINHGSGETKQYTASDTAPTTITAGTNGISSDQGAPAFLRYIWSTGYDQPGASGSGVFEPSQRLFGTATAGAYDSSNPNDDYSNFQPLYVGWKGDGSAGSSIGAILDPGATGTLQVDSVAAPAPAPTITITATPSTVAAGTSFTISWSTTDASTCTASGAWSGSQATSGSVFMSEAAAGSYTYTLSCTGTGGSTEESATEVVNSGQTPGGSVGAGGGNGGGGSATPFVLFGFLIAAALRMRPSVFRATWGRQNRLVSSGRWFSLFGARNVSSGSRSGSA